MAKASRIRKLYDSRKTLTVRVCLCLQRLRVCAQKVRVFERVRTQKSSLNRAHLFIEIHTAFYSSSFGSNMLIGDYNTSYMLGILNVLFYTTTTTTATFLFSVINI